MKNIEFLNLKAEPEPDRVVTKTKFEYELEESGRAKIQGPLAAFILTRTNYRDLPFTMYLESDGDRIGGSQDEAELVRTVLRMAGIGIVGTAAAAFSKAGSIGAATACFALTGTGKVLGSLAKAAIKQSIRMNPDLDLKEVKAVIESVTSSIPKTNVQHSKFDAAKMNQFEAYLLLEKSYPIQINGPKGLVIIDRSEDSKLRELYVVVSDNEITVRRKAEDAVAIALHLAGLSMASQIEEAGRKAATAGLGVVGKGTGVLAKGLNAAAGAALKMGALLVK